MNHAIYSPREDSFLLQRNIRKYAKQYSEGRILDMCTGSGNLAKEARKYAKNVIASDINPAAAKYFENSDIKFVKSDLFENLKNEQFNLIICNPPYLPTDTRAPDIALDGGKKGYEFIERFLVEAKIHLALGGTILLLFSSLSKKKTIERILKREKYLFSKIDSQKLYFEELYVYEICAEKWLARGRHGVVYQVLYGGKIAAMKVEKRTSAARFKIEHEAHFLKIVNKKKIGPRLYFSDDEKIIMELIEGERIADFLSHATKQQITSVIRAVLRQCRTLDLLNIDKEEMNHPYKHIIISNKGRGLKVTMIDFERARKTPTPKNVTQFCQFLTSRNIAPLLRNKVISTDKKKIQYLCAQYKNSKTDDESEKNHKKILDTLLPRPHPI